jgi:hypothetical protein
MEWWSITVDFRSASEVRLLFVHVEHLHPQLKGTQRRQRPPKKTTKDYACVKNVL